MEVDTNEHIRKQELLISFFHYIKIIFNAFVTDGIKQFP